MEGILSTPGWAVSSWLGEVQTPEGCMCSRALSAQWMAQELGQGSACQLIQHFLSACLKRTFIGC